jgi:hypothetical protein
MASRKELKKDIDYLIFELVADCYGCIYENPEKDMSGFETVINEAFLLKENLISRINRYNASPEEKPRVFFKSVREDLVNGLKDGYEKLEKIVG